VAIVAGVDFGTLSVRVTLLDSVRGRLGTASAEYPLARKRDDPDYATQSHSDQMQALVRAMRLVLEENHVDGQDVAAHGTRYDGVQRYSGGCTDAAARRLLPVVRPSRARGGSQITELAPRGKS